MSACCENYPNCSHVLADRYIREGNAIAAKNRELAELQAKLRAVTATASKAEAENEALRALVDRTAKAWLTIEGVPWRGDLADAVTAGVAEIERLRAALTDLSHILLDPEGNASFTGSEGDHRIAVNAFAALEGKP